MDKRNFRTIDNRLIERGIGEAVVECLNRKATTIVVFAEERDNEVLDLHALEGLVLEVDPATKQLKEAEARHFDAPQRIFEVNTILLFF